MAAVTAAMVKELREMTGAGMMDCKKALAATEGDMDKAVEFLREKGLAGAAKKAGRIAAEGIVVTALSADEKSAVVVEVNAETDFVAKNEKFQTYAADVAAQALNTSAADMDAFMEENDKEPRLILVQGVGAFIMEDDKGKAAKAQLLVKDAIKLAVYAESFGGPLHMTDDITYFITHWEAEAYRSKK